MAQDYFDPNDPMVQSQVRGVMQQQRDAQQAASLNPLAVAQTGGVQQEEDEANWLQEQIKNITPESEYARILKDEWGDKKVRGKILTSLGEFLRGAAAGRGRYVPFSDRMYNRAQKQYDSKMKALVGLERSQGLMERANLSNERVIKLAGEKNELTADIAKGKNKIAEMDLARKERSDLMGYMLGNANVAAKMAEIDRKKTSPANFEQGLMWELRDYFAQNNITNYEDKQRYVQNAADILNTSKLKAKHKPQRRPASSYNRLTVGSPEHYFNRRTGKPEYGNRPHEYNPQTGQYDRFDPRTGESTTDSTFTLEKDVAEAYRSFGDTGGQTRMAVGALAAAGANQDKIGGVWNSSMGELFRRLEIGGDFNKLMPSEVFAKISSKNAELMHATAMVGVRPAYALVQSLAEKVEQSPMGTLRSQIVAMAGFTLVTEFAQRRLIEAADPEGMDLTSSQWDASNPAFAQKLRDAIMVYTDAVLAGKNVALPTFSQIMQLPPPGGKYRQEGPPAAPGDINNAELLEKYQALPPMALPQ